MRKARDIGRSVKGAWNRVSHLSAIDTAARSRRLAGALVEFELKVHVVHGGQQGAGCCGGPGPSFDRFLTVG